MSTLNPGIFEDPSITDAVAEDVLAPEATEVVEAGDSIQPEQPVEEVAPLHPTLRTKRPEFTLSFNPRHSYVPPPAVHLGVGKLTPKYEKWLEARFAECFSILNFNPESEAEITPKVMKARTFLHGLVYLAVGENEVEKLTYAMPNSRFRDLDVAVSLKKFVLANLGILLPLRAYFGVKPAIFHPADSVVVPEAAAAEETPVASAEEAQG